MEYGLRVEVGVSSPGSCPVADTSTETGSVVTDVSRAAAPEHECTVTEEFTVTDGERPASEGLATVARYDDQVVYQFRRDRSAECVCERVEALGRPVSDVHAEDGTLYLSFHAPDIETVRGIVEDLRERFGGVHLRKLTRTSENSSSDLAVVDRGQLTERQQDVLETAIELGYFEHPKGANAGEVAAALDIAPSTFAEHLAAAQRKLLASIVTSEE